MKFVKETDLCAEFIKLVPKEWTVYPETGGFDILLVRNTDGFQIGIEAKLRLNAKVVCQAAEGYGYRYVDSAGPDCRAVLVSGYGSSDLSGVCQLIGIEVIRLTVEERSYHRRKEDGDLEFFTTQVMKFYPELPGADRHGYGYGSSWQECFPLKRIQLPDYVPDTIAGDSCPITLTSWKIDAIKLAVLLGKTGFLTRKDFKALRVSISRWTQGGIEYSWLRPGTERGTYIRGSNFPDFSAQHPLNYKQIEADFDEWSPRKEEEK